MSDRFANLVESACLDFETLRAFLTGDLSISAGEWHARAVAESVVHKALAKSFVFFTARARRIVEREASTIPAVTRSERLRFMKATAQLETVRDANEHGAERPTRSPILFHKRDGISIDDTSLVTSGPNVILIGPLNLSTIYPAVDRIRRMAGYASDHVLVS